MNASATTITAPRYRVHLVYDVSYFNDDRNLETETQQVTVTVEAYTSEQAQALAWKQQRREHVGCWCLKLLLAQPRKIPVRKSWRTA